MFQSHWEKSIPVPKSLHRHQRWWLQEDNVLVCQPLQPVQHARQLFTEISNEGWGAYLGDFTAKGLWSFPESKLHTNFLEVKAVMLALKHFEHLCRDQIVLIASDNMTVIACINKGRRNEISFSLCPSLETLVMVQPEEHCPTDPPYTRQVDCYSGQAFPTQPSYPDRMVSSLGNLQPNMLEVATPQIDEFASRFNRKLLLFVSPVLDKEALAVHGLSLSWEDMDRYAFPPTLLIANVINKILSHDCRRTNNHSSRVAQHVSHPRPHISTLLGFTRGKIFKQEEATSLATW